MIRPRLLAVSADPPWPIRGGFSLRAAHLLRELSDRWEVDLIVAAPAGADAEDAPPDAALRRTTTVRLDRPLPALRDPGAEADPARRAFAEALAGAPAAAILLFRRTEFLAHVGDRSSGPVVRPRLVVDRVDCSTLELARRIRTSKLAAPAAAARTVAAALHERRVARNADVVTLAGDHDAGALRRLRPAAEVHVVPNGVHALDDPRFDAESSVPTLLFTGSLGYYANVDAARYLAHALWPGIRARVPDARLVIAGRNPRPSVLHLGTIPGVEVRPDVPDMFAVLRQAWVSIAPMRCGAGVKNKVLEAWAVGRPVVMSPIAASGLALDEAARGLVVRSRSEAVSIVVALLRDRGLRHERGRSVQELARSRHTWERSADRLSRLLEGRPGGSGSRVQVEPHQSDPSS